MSDSDFLTSADHQIERYQRFVGEACISPFPPWRLDGQLQIHPWLHDLAEVEVQVWILMQEEIRPRLLQAEKGRSMHASLHDRWAVLRRLASRIEALKEEVTRAVPFEKPLAGDKQLVATEDAA